MSFWITQKINGWAYPWKMDTKQDLSISVGVPKNVISFYVNGKEHKGEFQLILFKIFLCKVCIIQSEHKIIH